jgi:hypothetical protein
MVRGAEVLRKNYRFERRRRQGGFFAAEFEATLQGFLPAVAPKPRRRIDAGA